MPTSFQVWCLPLISFDLVNIFILLAILFVIDISGVATTWQMLLFDTFRFDEALFRKQEFNACTNRSIYRLRVSIAYIFIRSQCASDLYSVCSLLLFNSFFLLISAIYICWGSRLFQRTSNSLAIIKNVQICPKWDMIEFVSNEINHKVGCFCGSWSYKACDDI